MPLRYCLNASVLRDDGFGGLFSDEEYRDVHEYYAVHPELPPTPLRSLPHLAAALGVATVDAKDESRRFGLTSFKIMGVRYAAHRLGLHRLARGLVCATAGNHGRAVARVAREKGVPCSVFVPAARTVAEIDGATRAARVAGMKQDGATVIEVDGPYEVAVRRAAAHGEQTGATILSDTSWPGYDEIPRWIMAGYTQIFEEAYGKWDRVPDVVLVQGGVGGLLCAAASWFAWRFGAARPFLIACEPEHAACLLESARAGGLVSLDGDLPTIMAGLRCAKPSPAAWPAIAAGVDAFVSVADERAIDAMGHLQQERPPIAGGPSGACGVAALAALCHDDALEPVRSACGMDRSTRALVVLTEAP